MYRLCSSYSRLPRLSKLPTALVVVSQPLSLHRLVLSSCPPPSLPPWSIPTSFLSFQQLELILMGNGAAGLALGRSKRAPVGGGVQGRTERSTEGDGLDKATDSQPSIVVPVDFLSHSTPSGSVALGSWHQSSLNPGYSVLCTLSII